MESSSWLQKLHIALSLIPILKYFIEKDEKENFVKGIVKWEHKLDTELVDSMLFNDIYRIINDTQLRNFQFKLLHHILPNNKLLPGFVSVHLKQ
jgi:hypothetical protein